MDIAPTAFQDREVSTLADRRTGGYLGGNDEGVITATSQRLELKHGGMRVIIQW